MTITADNFPDISLKNVGIVGIPPLTVISRINRLGAVIHDLDAKLVKNSIDGVTPHLPKVYCAILRTVVLNAINLPLDAIFIDIGPGKCDAALHVSTLLTDLLQTPVIATRNIDSSPLTTPICQCKMNLTEKFLAITEGVKRAEPKNLNVRPCKPGAGFWGVPPRDFSILELFPDNTHIYGWTRCMESKTPSDTNIEKYCNPEVPTIFFAQSFCAKTALAKFLADRHPKALFLDVDFHAGNSAKAKIQAFLELSGAMR